MKTGFAPLFAIVLLAVSCNEKPTGIPDNSDSIAVKADAAKIVAPAADTWSAKVEQRNNGSSRLVVAGTIYVRDSSIKPMLKKSRNRGAIDLSELVLAIAPTPAAKGVLANVQYTETASRVDKYRKVTIMSNGKQVASITVNAKDALKK